MPASAFRSAGLSSGKLREFLLAHSAIRTAMLEIALWGPVFVLLSSASLGCHSIFPTDPIGSDDEIDGGIILDASDDRGIPSACVTAEDCDDEDPCTVDTCADDGYCRFGIVDISLTATAISTIAPALDVALAGNFLLIAEADAGVEVFNVEVPDSPVKVGGAQTVGDALAIDANSSGVVVAQGEMGLETFSPPPDLTQLVHDEPGHGCLHGVDKVVGIAIGEVYSLAAVYADGVSLIGFSDFSDPTELADIDTTGRTVNAASSNDTCGFLADSLGGARAVIFDTGDGPGLGGAVSSQGRVVDVAVSKNTAVMAEYGSGFGVVDLSDPVNPDRLAYISSNSPGVAVSLLGQQTAVVAEEDGRILVYDLRDPFVPKSVSTWNAGSTPLGIDTFGGLVAVALGEDGAVILQTGCVPGE